MNNVPELSIVIPVYNEEETIRDLIARIARQRGVDREVIVVDGGSTDGTVAAAADAGDGFQVKLAVSNRGRGRQLNAGAAAARGDFLLFLHADSVFDDPDALRKGLDLLRAEEAARRTSNVAGRFRLTFTGTDADGTGYRLHERKARLGRQGCIHGDQGFLLPRAFFDDVGGFDEDLPVLEDTLFAERVRSRGTWILLQATIGTSPRRYRTEGMRQRDALNAILVNLGLTGWHAPLREVRGLYRAQPETAPLDLGPFFLLFAKMLADLPADHRRAVWGATARFVRDNAWQIPLMADIRRGKCEGTANETGPALRMFDRWVAPALAGAVGEAAACLLVKGWFYGSAAVAALSRR